MTRWKESCWYNITPGNSTYGKRSRTPSPGKEKAPTTLQYMSIIIAKRKLGRPGNTALSDQLWIRTTVNWFLNKERQCPNRDSNVLLLVRAVKPLISESALETTRFPERPLFKDESGAIVQIGTLRNNISFLGTLIYAGYSQSWLLCLTEVGSSVNSNGTIKIAQMKPILFLIYHISELWNCIQDTYSSFNIHIFTCYSEEIRQW